MRISVVVALALAPWFVACNSDDTVNHLPDGSHGSGSGGGDGGGSGSDGGGSGGATSCQTAIHTSAPDTVTLSGIIEDDAAFGTGGGGVPAVTLDAFRFSKASSLGTATSESPNGIYQLTATTDQLPVDYITMAKTGYKTARYFPRAPVANATAFSDLAMLTTAEASALAGQFGVTQDPGNGIVVVIVAGCQTQRLTGATVALSPAGSSTVKYFGGGSATDSTGVAVIFNAAPSDNVTLTGAAPGLAMHDFRVMANPAYLTMATLSEQ